MRSQNTSDFLGTSVQGIAKTSVFSDLDASFKKNPFTSDIYLKKDIDAVKQSIVNIILTGRFERPFQPRFGANIKSYIFENIDDNIIDSMSSTITDIVNLYEPRARVINVEVNESSADNNSIRVSITFAMKSTGVVAEVTTLLERVR